MNFAGAFCFLEALKYREKDTFWKTVPFLGTNIIYFNVYIIVY